MTNRWRRSLSNRNTRIQGRTSRTTQPSTSVGRISPAAFAISRIKKHPIVAVMVLVGATIIGVYQVLEAGDGIATMWAEARAEANTQATYDLQTYMELLRVADKIDKILIGLRNQRYSAKGELAVHYEEIELDLRSLYRRAQLRGESEVLLAQVKLLADWWQGFQELTKKTTFDQLIGTSPMLGIIMDQYDLIFSSMIRLGTARSSDPRS